MKRQITKLFALAAAFLGLQLFTATPAFADGEPSVLNNAYLWLDASDSSTITITDGKVTKWTSRNTSGKAATSYSAGKATSGPTVTSSALAGMNVVDFGAVSSGKDLQFDQSTSVRAVFMVVDIADSGNAFILGASNAYHFHRDGSKYFHSSNSSANLRNGQIRRNREAKAYNTAIGTGYGLITLIPTGGVTAGRICQDRDVNENRTGGKKVAELIIFTSEITDTQRDEIETYLTNKWFPAHEAYGATVSGARNWFDSGLFNPAWANGALHDANITVGADASTLTIDQDLTAGTVNVTSDANKSFTLAKADGKTATVTTYNFANAAGKTTVNFETGSSAVTAGSDTVLTANGTGALTVAAGKKATLVDNATMGSYTTTAGSYYRWNNTSAAGTYNQGSRAPIANGNVTNGFSNATVTYDTGRYLLRVENNDNITLKKSGNYIDTLITMTGGQMTLGSTTDAMFFGGVTGWVMTMTDGEVTFPYVNSSGDNAYGKNLSIGWSGSRAYTLNIAGGTFNIPSTKLMPWQGATINVTGTGVLKAKGVYGGVNGTAGAINVNNGGELQIGSFGIGAVNPAKLPVTLGASGKLSAYENVTVNYPITIGGAATLAAPTDVTFGLSGTLSGSGSLTKAGEGTVTLSGTLSYSGTTTVNEGTLKVPAGQLTGNVSLGAGGTLDVTGPAGQAAYLITAGTFAQESGSTLYLNGKDYTEDGYQLKGNLIIKPKEATVSGDTTWTALWGGTEPAATDAVVLKVTGTANLTLGGTKTIADLIVESSAGNKLTIVDSKNLTVTEGCDFSSALGKVALGDIDPVEDLAKNAVAGAPYSYWLFAGVNVLGGENIAPPPTMPKGYTAVLDNPSGHGPRFIATAPATAKFGSISVNFYRVPDKGDNIGVVADDATTHGVIPVAGSSWNNVNASSGGSATLTKYVAKDGTAKSDGSTAMTYSTGDWSNSYSWDQIYQGYIDGSGDKNITLSGIPFTKYRIIVHRAVDSDGGKTFAEARIGTSSSDAISYYGPTVGEYETGGATIGFGTDEHNWGSSKFIQAHREGVNYIVSDVLTGGTAYIRSKDRNPVRAGVSAIQIVEVGDYVREYAVTITTAGTHNLSGIMPSPFNPNPSDSIAITVADGVTDSVTVNFDIQSLSIGAATFVSAGSAALNLTGTAPAAISAYDFSGVNGAASVGFATGTAAVSAGADTTLTAAGTGTLTIAAGKKATVPAWAGSALSGAGTIVYNADAAATAVAPGAFSDNFTGNIKLTQGTWTVTGNYPQQRMVTVEGANAKIIFNCGDPTGHSPPYPNLYVADGGAICFQTRDTFTRELVLTNAFVELGGAHTLDLYGKTVSGTYYGSKISVYGPGTSYICGTTHGTTENAGSLCVRREDMPVWIAEGATLDVYSTWGFNYESCLAYRCVKQGPGTIIFRNAPVQTGSFTVSGGTLKMVDAGSPTTGEIALAENTALALEMATAQTVANAITGAGTVTKTGAGTVTLTGANAYSGATLVNGGTLKIADGASAGTGYYSVVADATLHVGTNRTLTVVGASTGAVALTMTAAEKALFDANEPVEFLSVTDNAFGGTIVAYDQSGNSYETDNVTVSGGKITFTRKAGARIPPFNLVDKTGDLAWTTAGWVDSTPGNPETVQENDWNSTVNANIALTSGTATLMADRAITLGTLAVTNAGTLTVSASAPNALTAGTLAVTNTGTLAFTGDAFSATTAIDDSASTGETTIGFAPGAAAVAAGANTILNTVGSGAYTIAADKKLTVKASGLNQSQLTNEGTLNFDGGTEANPIEYTFTTSDYCGKVTLATNAYVNMVVDGNKRFDVTGAGTTQSFVKVTHSTDGTGMSDNASFRNVTLISGVNASGKYLWVEKAGSVDSTVDLVSTGTGIYLAADYTVNTISGSGTFANKALTLAPTHDADYSGATGIGLTVGGTAVQTLSGAYTGALTVNAGGKVALSGTANPSSVTSAGQVTVPAGLLTHNVTLNSGAVLNVTGTPGQASYVITSGTFVQGEGATVQLNGTALPTADYTVVGNAIVRRKAATIDTASTTWDDLWGANPPTSGDLVELSVSTPATLSIGPGAQAAALKVTSDADNKLTLAGATNLTAAAYDFSAANGKVAFDYAGITTDTTLLSGTIAGADNIDATGVPSGAALIVTPDAVRLVFNEKYQKFSYGTVYSWLTTAAGTVDLAGGDSNFQEFDIASCTNKTTVYHGNTDFGGVDKGKFWHQFAYASSTPIKDVYAAPGEILRLAQGSYCTSISATYGPLAFGGIIAEPGDAAFTFVNGSAGTRSNILGDPTATVPTFFDIGANVTFDRTGKLYLAGTLTFDIANGKTLDLNSAQTSYDLALFNTVAADVSGAFGATTAGGTLIMKGEGTLKVATLKAEGSTLDFSNLPADRASGYIDGTLQIDHDTMLVLPAALETSTPFPLATAITGSATGPRYIRLGTGEPVEKYVTFSEGKVSYDDISFYTAKLATSGEFKDLVWSPTKPEGGFAVEDELILTNSAIATLNFTTPATAGVFRVVNAADEPLTIKVSAADMNVLEWVFTGANGKVKFDYAGLSSTTTLITGTIVGAENIDTSNVPDGYKLVVTDSSVTLTLATELMLYGYAFDGNGNKRAEASANFSPAVSGNYVQSSSGQAMTVTASGGYGSTFNLGDQDFTAVFVARSSDAANNNVYYAFGNRDVKGFALTSNGSNGTKLISWNNNSVELAQALDVATGVDAAVGFHLYAFKYVKATGKAYYSVDGAAWTETASGFQWGGSKDWQLGSVHTGKPEGLHSGDAGALDEMRFYTAHLSQAQLSALTDELTGKCFTKTLTGSISFSDIAWDGGKAWTGGDDVYVGLRASGDVEPILTLNAAVNAKVVRVISAAGKDLKIGKNTSETLSITGYDFYDALGKTTVNYQSAGTTIIPGANTVMTSIPQVAIEVKANKKLTLGWNAIGTAYAQVISGAGAVDITGQVQLSANNTFTGAMTVKDGGTLKMGQHHCLNGINAVTVDAGGTLDANNASGTDFALTLNGGTLVNTASSEISHNARMMGSLTLTADSTVNLTSRNYGLISSSWGTTSMTLNGYKLTKQGSGKFYLVGTTVSDAGTIDVRAGELSLPNRGSYNCSFANGTIELNGGTLSIDTKTLTLKGLTVNDGTVSNGGTLTGLAVLGGTAMDFTAFTGSGTLVFADAVTVASGTTTLSSAAATALADKTVTVAEGATLNLGTIRPTCKIGKDSAGTIRLTLSDDEKGQYDAGTLAINLATDATAAGPFAGAIAMFDTNGSTQLYGAASFKDVGGTITLVVEKAADAKTPPFNLTNPTGSAVWTAEGWLDSSDTPQAVVSADWGIQVAANIALASGEATRTLDRSISISTLNITNAGALAIEDGGYTLTAATIDDSASTGTTSLDFELGTANVTAGKDTRIGGSSEGSLTVGAGNKATLVDATFGSYTASNGAFFRWNNAEPTTYTQASAAPIGNDNVTNAFSNATVTYDTGAYLLRVEDGDNVTLKQSGKYVDARIVMMGGNLDFGGGEAFFLGKTAATILDMTGGTATYTHDNGGSTEHAQNFSVGYSYNNNYIVNIAGGALNVPNAYILPWEGARFYVSNGGIVRAKGIYRRNGGNTSGRLEINAGGTVEIGAYGIVSESANQFVVTLNGGTLANCAENIVSNGAAIAVSAASVISNDYAMAVTAPLSGSGAIAKKGTGTLTLASLANYTGAITIEAGTVDIGEKRGLTVNGETVCVTLTDGEVGGGEPIALFTGTATVGKIMYGGADITSKCTVSDGTITAIDYEAKVGTTYYLSLATAIGEATEGSTITLLKDVTAAQEIAVGQAITLEGGTNILENVTFSGATGTLVLNSGCIGVAYADCLSITNGICRFNGTSKETWKDHVPTGYAMADLSAAVREGYQYEFVKSAFVPTDPATEQLIPVADQNDNDLGAIKLNTAFVNSVTTQGATPQQQAEELNQKQLNNLKKWQNAVLGLDGTKAESKPVVTFSQSSSSANQIAFTLGGCAIPADSGATVTFKVYSADAPGESAIWKAETGDTLSGESAVITLPTSGVKYYTYDVAPTTSK